MKIEIGESLAVSYLKHVKRCVIYQTNWKSSSQWAFLGEVGDASEAFERLVRMVYYHFKERLSPASHSF